MRALVWRRPLLTLVAAAPFAALLAVELTTSRRAPAADPTGDVGNDTATGAIFDAAATVALVGGIGASLRVRRLTMPAQPVAYALGLAAMSGALALSAWARQHLGRFHRHTLTSHHDHTLITSGPYRHLRHPLYTATLSAFTGIGLTLGNWASLGLATVPPLAALVHRIRVEERLLIERLGDEYHTYSERTARLVPGIW